LKNVIYLILLLFLVAPAGCKQKQAGDEGGGAEAPGLGSESELTLLQDVVKKDPGNANAWLKLGNIYMDTQRNREAVDSYTHYLDLVPNNVDARVDLGTCYHRMGEPEKALEQYKRAIQINPNHAMAHFNMAVVLANDLGRRQEAAAEFERYLALNPSDPRADNLREEIKKLQQQPAGK
jgi:tetratricopeptide (TPR) repeat protein